MTTPFRVRHGLVADVSSNTQSAIVASNQVLTGSANTSLVDLATTWNTTGTPTALKLNVTDTQSGSGSLLMDLQVGGASRFRVSKAGATTVSSLLFPGSSSGTVTIQPASAAGTYTLTLPTSAGSNGQALVTNGSGVLSFATVTSPPGGSNTQVQFNNSGAFEGDAGLTFNSTTKVLTLDGGSLVISGNISSTAWTTNGLCLRGVTGTLTDTSSSGTVAAAYTNVLDGNTIAASNATTFTNYYTTWFNAPTAGTNVTFTGRWAMGLGGSLDIQAGTVTTNTTPALNLTQTWNAGAVTFTGLRFNAAGSSNANSASGSLLMDLQVGGVSKFSFRKDGFIISPDGTYASGSNSSTIGFYGGSSSTDGAYFVARGNNFVTSAQRGQLQLYSNSTGGSTGGAGNIVFGTYNGGYAVRMMMTPSGAFGWGSGTFPDVVLNGLTPATLQLGAADAAAPVAQTFKVQGVVAGTTNTAGANFTIQGSQGTGTGAGGSIIFQVAPAGSSGTAQNALATALTIDASTSTTGVAAAGSLSVAGGRYYISSSADSVPGIFASANKFIGFSGHNTNATSSATYDVLLARDAANTLALRNGNNGQTFRLYGRFTDITNDFERFFISAPTTSGDAVLLGTQKGATTGSARAIEFQTDSVTRMTIANTGAISITSSLNVANTVSAPNINSLTSIIAPMLGAL